MARFETGIDGLIWSSHRSLPNGGESFVVPLPTNRLVHVVFHGEDHFAHGRYGLHYGLEDRLTFVGSSDRTITGHFVDCRAGSPTLHRRVTIEFQPAPDVMLTIPCGVGHGFAGLEGVFSLNEMGAFMPPPATLMTNRNPWSTGADILNFAYETSEEDLPVVKPNRYPASDLFYETLRQMQEATLDKITHEFPHTEQYTTSDGSIVTLAVRRELQQREELSEWEAISGIAGLGWKRHLVVWSDSNSGYIALTDPSPMQLISHGSSHYRTDAYGVHQEWEDRLTFLGPSAARFTISFLDCRQNSPTLGSKVEIEVQPSVLRMLVIPPGVAHAFDGLQDIWTINRPIRRAGDPDDFEPGNDVVDIPLEENDIPTFVIGENSFGEDFYRNLVEIQRKFLNSGTLDISTPAVLIAIGNDGERVPVAIRKPVAEPAALSVNDA